MDKPYIRKLETMDEFEVWEVDGMYVRNNLNREFTNFGQHFRFPFIPKHEFWIDKENTPGELPYYVDHMIVEWSLMNQGSDYDTAITKADRREQGERKKSALMEKIRKEPLLKKEVPKEMYVHKLMDLDSLQVWVVNGELVRDLYFIDFTEGGHHFVYDFVPYSEVWLDNDLVSEEREFVLLHELHERYLMFKGMDYNHAHSSSSYIEYRCRHHPTKLQKYLNGEFEKNALVIVEQVSALV